MEKLNVMGKCPGGVWNLFSIYIAHMHCFMIYIHSMMLYFVSFIKVHINLYRVSCMRVRNKRNTQNFSFKLIFIILGSYPPNIYFNTFSPESILHLPIFLWLPTRIFELKHPPALCRISTIYLFYRSSTIYTIYPALLFILVLDSICEGVCSL